MAAATLAFDILARDRASRTFKDVGDNADRAHGRIDRFGGGLGNLAKSAGLAAVGVAGLAVVVGKGFVDAAIESKKVTAQTNAVIKSMGGASKVTAKHVANLSEKLSLQTGIDDELIQSGENILLTFGKIRNEAGKGNKIFDRATKAALDLSVAWKIDMKAASIQVGKALNDPIKGITALSKAGVQFTQQQKDQIKAMVFYGDTVGAQKLILAELEAQVGGSAAAQATAVDKLKVVWGNFAEEMGAILLPVVEDVATWLAEHLPAAMETLKRWIDNTGKPALEDLKEAFERNVLPPLETIATFVKEELIPALGDLVGWFVEDILPAMEDVAGFIKDELLPRFGDIVSWIKDNDARLTTFKLTILGLAAAWGIYSVAAAAAGLATLLPFLPAIAVIAGLAVAIVATRELIDRFKEQLLIAFAHILFAGGKVIGFFGNLWDAISPLIVGINLIVEMVKWLIDHIPDIPDIPDVRPGAGVPFVPFLDNGGVMPGRRGVHSLAMVAGGETVLPTHKAPAASFAGGESITLNVTQLPGENQVDAGMRALRHHRQTRLVMQGAG